MVWFGRPRLVVLNGGKAGNGAGEASANNGTGGRAFGAGPDAASCMVEIFTIIEEMAGRTASPNVFRARLSRHFRAPSSGKESERRRQASGMLKRLERFRREFHDYMRENKLETIPDQKIVAVVEQIMDRMGQAPAVREGWRRPPPDSA